MKLTSLYVVDGATKCIPCLLLTISVSIVDVSLVPTLAKLTDAVVGMQGSVASMAATVAALASQQPVLLEMMMHRAGWSFSDGYESQHSLMTALFAATAASTKAVAEVASSTVSLCSSPVTLSSVQLVLFRTMNPAVLLAAAVQALMFQPAAFLGQQPVLLPSLQQQSVHLL